MSITLERITDHARIKVDTRLTMARESANNMSSCLMDIYQNILSNHEGHCRAVADLFDGDIALYADGAANEIRFLSRDYMPRHDR